MPNGWDERQGQEEASLIGLDMKGEGIPCCVAADNVRLGSGMVLWTEHSVLQSDAPK